MKEIIFEKSRRNLRKVYNRLQTNTIASTVGRERVLFLAIGGYNRTHELLIEMGLKPEDIATFQSLNLSHTFLQQSHMKKVIYVRKINYVTSVNKTDYTSRTLDLNVADAFEESMMIYKTANRKIVINRQQVDWIKPTVVILDDQSLNLQTGGHRFHYQNELGFVQVRSRNASPQAIIDEIKEVEEADRLMFSLYQKNSADEAAILDALNELRLGAHRAEGTNWYFKPTEYKKLVGSNDLANAIKETPELKITQLKSNKRLDGEIARWVIVPEEAFEFKGFSYLDEEDLFEEEIREELESEEEFARQQEELLNNILSIEFPINLKAGYVGNKMEHNPVATLQDFLDGADEIDTGIELLEAATTKEEYENIKKHNLIYFLDGIYKNNERTDENYQRGKRLIVLDIDDEPYEREELEEKLEEQGLFGFIYPTPRRYFDGSKRWRIVLMADEVMTLESYKTTVDGVVEMLELDADDASSKPSQLMGYPFRKKDVSVIIGTQVNVKQFKAIPKNKQNIFSFSSFANKSTSTKSLLDFNHDQARLLKEAVTHGIPEGQRNDSYRQIVMYLRDTLDNPELKQWHKEASDLLNGELEGLMRRDGLPEKEMEMIMR